jgi:hypothetical protein
MVLPSGVNAHTTFFSSFCFAMTGFQQQYIPQRRLLKSLPQRIGIKIEANANLYVVGIATY